TRAEGAGPGSMRTWRAYEPPTPGTPVLVVSDLGISRSRAAGGASPEEWLAFADLVAATGRRCVALVPFPPHRWPAALERAMHIVHWDRTTSVHTVQRALRGAAPEASEFSPRL